jgi:uncharacterized RDD family membrane protein YckC
VFCPRCGTHVPPALDTCPLCHLIVLGPEAGRERAPQSSPALVYAGFWRRLAASSLDGVLLLVLMRALEVMNGGEMFPDPTNSSSDWNWATLAGQVLVLVYTAGMMASREAGTLGMQIMDLRIQRVDGRRAGLGVAVLRWFASLLSFLTLGLGYLVMLIHPRRQTLHDLIAGTVIVRRGESWRSR